MAEMAFLGMGFSPYLRVHTATKIQVHTHLEQLGVRCLAQGSHLSRGQFLPEPRFEPTTSGYKSDALSIRPRLPQIENELILQLGFKIGSFWTEKVVRMSASYQLNKTV